MTGNSKGQKVRDVRFPAPPEQSSLESRMPGKRARPVWGGAAETDRKIPRRPPTPLARSAQSLEAVVPEIGVLERSRISIPYAGRLWPSSERVPALCKLLLIAGAGTNISTETEANSGIRAILCFR